MSTCFGEILRVFRITNLVDFVLFSAFRMAETEEYCAVDAVLSDLQKTKVPMGTTSRTPRYV